MEPWSFKETDRGRRPKVWSGPWCWKVRVGHLPLGADRAVQRSGALARDRLQGHCGNPVAQALSGAGKGWKT